MAKTSSVPRSRAALWQRCRLERIGSGPTETDRQEEQQPEDSGANRPEAHGHVGEAYCEKNRGRA